jgi:hypothetical protein
MTIEFEGVPPIWLSKSQGIKDSFNVSILTTILNDRSVHLVGKFLNPGRPPCRNAINHVQSTVVFLV